MDDTCAVCAETLEWVAYGPCGHRDVCSTCVIRLRFICHDKHCCICKSESNIIFITKALGDYTKMISDFSAFPANPTEGEVELYWYHEGTQAYFDDSDHYKMIKAMSRLLCVVCDRKDEQRSGLPKKVADFTSIQQLKGHLFHRHGLFMCSLCLEGRKIFISEQKLYKRAQLTQHMGTGDSVVDGSESERAGFMGHPMCKFCQTPFYGDNELYLHMSTEHFTCHLCQRQHPGHYEYYNDYDDLEIHFHQKHFLCEDEACLAKKFIVFATESERKRHAVVEHGGRSSRSKRSAAAQIPISFQCRQSNERDRCGGGHVSRHSERHENVAILNPFESLATADYESPSRFRQVSSGIAPLEEVSFPPLPMASSSNQQRSKTSLEGLSRNTMAAHLRRQNTVKVLNFSQSLPAAIHTPSPSASISYRSSSMSGFGPLSSSSSLSCSQTKPATATAKECVLPTNASSTQARLSTSNASSNCASSSRTSSSTSKVNHSASAPNLVDRGTFENSISNFPPVSATRVDKESTSSLHLLKVEDVQSANKALVEKIRSSLEFDEDKFASFKIISVEYRQDVIGTGEYLAYVYQFGLSHLVLELARLCPNAHKQRELVEIYNYNRRINGSNENGLSIDNGRSKSKKSSKKGKEECEDNEICSLENNLADSCTRRFMTMKSNHGSSMEKAEIIPKSGYCSAKGKSKSLVDEQANSNSSIEPMSKNDVQSSGGGSQKNVGVGGGVNKPCEKTSKFLRNRLGHYSASAVSDAGNSDTDPDKNEDRIDGNSEAEVLPVHGVWRNRGGQKLVAMAQRDEKK